MGSCFSSQPVGERVAVPQPRSVEDWARVGVPAVLRVHGWLRGRAAAREAGSTMRTLDGRVVRPPRIILDFKVPPADACGLGDDCEGRSVWCEEDAITLRMNASNIANAAHGSPNLLINPHFRRAAAWLVANRALIAASCDARFWLKAEAEAIPTRAPEMNLNHVRALLRLFVRLDAGGTGLVEEEDLSQLLARSGKPSIGDSVFFGAIASCAAYARDVIDGERAGYGAGTGGLALGAADFVTAIDTFCTLSHEGLARLSFYLLAVVGSATPAILEAAEAAAEAEIEREDMEINEERAAAEAEIEAQQVLIRAAEAAGEIPPPPLPPLPPRTSHNSSSYNRHHLYPPAFPPSPFIAVSSLVRFFPAFEEAQALPSHPSRSLLDELRIRRESVLKRRGPAAQAACRVKEEAFVALCERAKVGGLPNPRNQTLGSGRIPSSPLTPPVLSHGSSSSSPRGAAGIVLHLRDEDEDEWGDENDGRARDAEIQTARDYSRPSWEAVLAAHHPQVVSKVCKGPDDLLSFNDYADAMRKSPGAFFDLIYLQKALRKVR